MILYQQFKVAKDLWKDKRADIIQDSILTETEIKKRLEARGRNIDIRKLKKLLASLSEGETDYTSDFNKNKLVIKEGDCIWRISIPLANALLKQYPKGFP